MRKVFKLLARITAIVFIAMLGWVYAFLPVKVNLLLDKGSEAFTYHREMFFYGCLAAFVICTLMMSYLKKSLSAMPAAGGGTAAPLSKKEKLRTWADSMSVVLNLFFIFTLAFIGMGHNDQHFTLSNFSALIYFGPLLVAGWIFYLLYILLSRG